MTALRKIIHVDLDAFYASVEHEIFCRIRGYLSTLQKQGHHLFDALAQLLTGVPISPIQSAE